MKNIKLVIIALFALPMLALAFSNANVGIGAAAFQEDAATVYKTRQCVVCHTAKAEKFFDPTKPDAELVEIVLKGKKGEKPPPMPGFEAKGMTAEQAGALVTYMKTLRAPAE